MTLLATLRDTSVASDNPADVELIHDLRLEAIVSVPDLIIQNVSARANQQPYDHCNVSLAPMSKLVGLSLRRGYRRQVQAALGGTLGCSHFLTLALELSSANVLSIYLRMRKSVSNTPGNRANGNWIRAGLQVEPQLLNACIALAADSPVIQQALSTAPAEDASED